MARKKICTAGLEQRRQWVSKHPKLSIRRQCTLLGLHRSGLAYTPATESEENLTLMRWLDEQYTRCPYYGSRRMTALLKREGQEVNRKRIQRLMRKMGLEALYPKPNLSRAHAQHVKYPYLLRGVEIVEPNHVWSTDITYIRMSKGWMYLVAVIDWYSRYVLSWKLSNTLENVFCVQALEQALQYSVPRVFNTDQGSQFTSMDFIEVLKGRGIAISMDGKGRALDNVFVERLWRTVKYEDIYLKDYETVNQLRSGLAEYFSFYNTVRLHQSLDYRTPQEVYLERKKHSNTEQESSEIITLN